MNKQTRMSKAGLDEWLKYACIIDYTNSERDECGNYYITKIFKHIDDENNIWALDFLDAKPCADKEGYFPPYKVKKHEIKTTIIHYEPID